MMDFRGRLLMEFADLQEKIAKLEKFILSGAYDGLSEIDRADLKEQLGCMQAYYKVLKRRASRLCVDA
jgi:hypothetical protein